MKQILADIGSFFRDDLLPNIGHYLLQAFLILVVLVVFTAITIVVRLFIDPVMFKVFRLREGNRLPGLLSLILSLVILAYVLIFSVNRFAPIRPTVVGWAGENLRELVKENGLPGADLGTANKPLFKSKTKKVKKTGTPAPVPSAPLNKT